MFWERLSMEGSTKNIDAMVTANTCSMEFEKSVVASSFRGLSFISSAAWMAFSSPWR